ncbi:MAG: M24 family metallopeptidase [Merdibacter sp.]
MNAMYTSEVVEPDVTTTQDLEWFMMQKVKDMGLDYWFEPTMDLQREGSDDSHITGVIRRGDLLHCDFGIRYMNLCTDTQRLAYVIKKEDAIQDLANGMKVNNRFRTSSAAV